MPCLRILTNVPNSKIPKDFVSKIIPVLAKTVRKPEDKFVCVISGDCQVTFGDDSTSPGAAATLESIGNVAPEDNKVIGAELSAFIHKELGVHPERTPGPTPLLSNCGRFAVSSSLSHHLGPAHYPRPLCIKLCSH